MRSPPSGTIPQAVPQVQSGQAALIVNARFGRDFPQPIASGLIWRVYLAKPDPSRPFVPIKEERAAAPVFVLPPGDYVVHVSFGLASAARPVSLRTETTREFPPGRSLSMFTRAANSMSAIASRLLRA